ncbi:MAG: hypothetical protein WC068_11520 [Caulobacter sp.]
MMTDGLDREASLEHRAARWLNTTMVSLLHLAGAGLGLWLFFSSLPALNAILGSLSPAQQETLSRTGGGLMLTLVCLVRFLPSIRREPKRKD